MSGRDFEKRLISMVLGLILVFTFTLTLSISSVGDAYAEELLRKCPTEDSIGWFNSPALGDIDGDGDIEMVVGDRAGVVYAFELDCQVLWTYKTGGAIYSSPALRDIDGDGDIEVVIGSSDNFVYALNGEDGSLLWRYETDSEVNSSPAVEDIDGDGDIEVVIGSKDDHVYALNGEDGSLLWKYKTGGDVWSSPAVGDVNDDGDIEVVIGSADNYIYALNGEDGSLLWKYETGGDVISSPALGDIDGNGDIEIVIGSEDSYIYALNGEDGSLLWKYKTDDPIVSSPALGDIDGDDNVEVVIGSYDYQVYVLNGEEGSLSCKYETGDIIESSPALGDLDEDEGIEVVIGSGDNYIHVFNGEDCSPTWKIETGRDVDSSPALEDMDGDGKLEIVVGSWDDHLYILQTEGELLPELPGPWPKFRGNLGNSGYFAPVICPPEFMLKPNEPVTGVIGPGLTMSQYCIKVSKEAKETGLLAIALQSPGNLNLHIRHGKQVKPLEADFSLVSPDGNEFIIISKPQLKSGIYFIALENMEETEQEFTLIALPLPNIYIEGFPALGSVEPPLLEPLLRYLQTERGLLSFTQYKVTVPKGAKSLMIRLEGLEGKNVDLHIRYGEPVEIKDGRVVADLSSISLTGEEAVVISGEFLKPGTYYIAVEGLEPPQEFKITVTIDHGGGHQTAALTPFRMV